MKITKSAELLDWRKPSALFPRVANCSCLLVCPCLASWVVSTQALLCSFSRFQSFVSFFFFFSLLETWFLYVALAVLDLTRLASNSQRSSPPENCPAKNTNETSISVTDWPGQRNQSSYNIACQQHEAFQLCFKKIHCYLIFSSNYNCTT